MFLGLVGGALVPLKGSVQVTRETKMSKTLVTVEWWREEYVERKSISKLQHSQVSASRYMYDNMDARRGVKNGAKWHQFPIATGTNDHKLSGLKKNTTLFSYNSGGSKLEMGLTVIKSRC